MGKLDGKVALIAYAGGGLGKASAELFEKEGAKVFVQDDDAAKLEGVPGEHIIADLRKKEDADKMIQTVLEKGGGKINILVNNEDFVPAKKKILDLTTEQFIDTIDRNLRTIWHTLAAIYPTVKAQAKIHIVNIGSAVGAGGASKLIDYASVKSGLYGLTKTVAKEWQRFGGVRCNMVNIGTVKYPEGYAKQGAQKAGLKEIKNTPMNALVNDTQKLADVANVILFLASDDSEAINAATIDGFGGMYVISGE